MIEAPVKQTVPDILNAAADLIDKDGWAQGAYTTTDGKHCVMGAIALVCPVYNQGDVEQINLRSNVFEALLRCLKGNNPLTWNDKSGQTGENVIKTLRECAEAES